MEGAASTPTPVQASLFPDSGSPGDPRESHTPEPPSPAPPSGDGPAPVWLQRLSLFTFVLFCVYLGVILMILPWCDGVWESNVLLRSFPRLYTALRLPFTRGLLSGFGLLDIWIGLSEAIHFRAHRR